MGYISGPWPTITTTPNTAAPACTAITRNRRTNAIFKSSMPFLLLLVLLLSPSAPVARAAGFRLCGLKLTMTLNAICKNQLCGGYMFGMAKKRSPLSSLDDDPWSDVDQPSNYAAGDDDNEYNDEPNEQSLFALGEYRRMAPVKRSSNYRSHPYGVFGVTKKNGIATECCMKRCTLSYLKTYCCATPSFNENNNTPKQKQLEPDGMREQEKSQQKSDFGE